MKRTIRIEQPSPAPDPPAVTLNVREMPGLIADLRREMAKLLRAEARRQEDNVVGWAVARSLKAVANAFEGGVAEQDMTLKARREGGPDA